MQHDMYHQHGHEAFLGVHGKGIVVVDKGSVTLRASISRSVQGVAMHRQGFTLHDQVSRHVFLLCMIVMIYFLVTYRERFSS